MLNIIEPKNYRAYQTRIDSFLDLLKVYQNFSLPTEELEDATFIIASDNEYGVYGGTLLLKKDIWSLERRIRDIVLTFQPEMDTLWTGRIGFYRGHESPFSLANNLEKYFDFYRNLLEAFNDFGNKEEITFLCLTLNPIEHLKLNNYGFWEYVAKILPHESLDALFHGILPLSRRVN
ncbi:MAG: hypothetical protein K2X02_02505 [Alphaproteobacteria bacterium]|nr:hypothetical protein [Alphaproteobacteria bacterium]